MIKIKKKLNRGREFEEIPLVIKTLKSVSVFCGVFTLRLPIRWRTSKEDRQLQILLINPSKKITSDRHIHRLRRLHGKALRSLKSCNCMALAKSNVMQARFGHLFARSCKTGDVISSHGSSMYFMVAPNLIPIRVSKASTLCTCSPPYSGLSETLFHNRGSQASSRHFLHTRATFPSSWCFRNEKM